MRRGFTLIELLVVIAIIAILAAILFPVFVSAKASARKAQCQSNMKQIAIATMRYVDDWNRLQSFDPLDNPMANNWNFGQEVMNRISPYITGKGGYMDPVTGYKSVFRCPSGTPSVMRNAKDPFRGIGYGWNGCVSVPGYSENIPWKYCLGGNTSGIKKPSRTAMWGEVMYPFRGWGPFWPGQYMKRHGSSASFTALIGNDVQEQAVSNFDPRKDGGFMVAWWDGHVSFVTEVPGEDGDTTGYGRYSGVLLTWLIPWAPSH